jgi:hypothetical protein
MQSEREGGDANHRSMTRLTNSAPRAKGYGAMETRGSESDSSSESNSPETRCHVESLDRNHEPSYIVPNFCLLSVL